MKLFNSLGFSVVILLLYIVVLFSLRQILPPQNELVAHLSGLYSRFGYEMIFIGAFLESLVLINFLVPGVVAIGLGAVFARVGELNLGYGILAATAGCVLGYIIDYVIGSMGIGEILKRISSKKTLDEAKSKVERYALVSFLLGFTHPNIGAFMSVAVGASKITFKVFLILSTLSTLAWMSLWGILIFAFGNLFLIILTKYVFAISIFLFSAWLLIFMLKKKYK